LPIYEYECTRCGHRFELRRSFSEDGSVTCPQCGCDAQRIFSPVPIIFKGSGFYATDNRGNHGHSTPTSDGDGIKAGSKDEAKAGNTEESKPSSIEAGS
jgi:putative FmdB family regulatory protein